jgi:hypothetical protein
VDFDVLFYIQICAYTVVECKAYEKARTFENPQQVNIFILIHREKLHISYYYTSYINYHKYINLVGQ